MTPRLNESTARSTGEYEELSNALKLVLPEGDIDVILAGAVTRELAQDVLDVDGRYVPVEPASDDRVASRPACAPLHRRLADLRALCTRRLLVDIEVGEADRRHADGLIERVAQAVEQIA